MEGCIILVVILFKPIISIRKSKEQEMNIL